MKRNALIILCLLVGAGLVALRQWRPAVPDTPQPVADASVETYAPRVSEEADTPTESGELSAASIPLQQGPSQALSPVSSAQSTTPCVFRYIKTDNQVPLNPEMDMIIGNDPEAGMARRVKAISNLGNNLSAAEINSLYALMAKTGDADPIHPDFLNVIKNAAACKLRNQLQMPAHYANNLVAMFLDPKCYQPN